MHAGEENVGKERFEAEVNVEVGVFVLRLLHAADDEDGNGGVEIAQTFDELGAVHAGHDVIGDDEVDGGGVFVAAKLFESALGTQNGDDVVSGTLEDGLARSSLDSVVVKKKEGGGHCRCGVSFWLGLRRTNGHQTVRKGRATQVS